MVDLMDPFTTDTFTFEIIRNYFLSTVREMIGITVRSAYSTCFSEGLDFTCGLFDSEARLFAQAGGNPVHIGALDDELTTVLRQIGDIAEGDVILHNDPFEGADHQSDVVVAMPMFSGPELIGFSVNRGHWSDIGGMHAGGYGLASHVVQEGLIIPACKLVVRGEVNREIREFILKNVRLPRLVWGDLQAQVASAQTAAARLQELIASYDLETVRRAIAYTFEYTRRRFIEGLKTFPDGIFVSEDILDDDGRGGGPYRIRVAVEKTRDQIVVDFEGTDIQAPGPANCTIGATKASVYAALIAVVDPEISYSSSLRELIHVEAPLGTIVNPVRPAPVSGAPADPSIRVCETVLRALGHAIPSKAVAGSFSSGLNMPGWGLTSSGQEFMWYMFGPGGTGARTHRDGVNAEWHTMVMAGNESMELWETRYPLRFLRRELRADSAGAGRTRGGLGEVRVVECLADTLVSAYIDRCVSLPWGIQGGDPGTANEVALERNGIEQRFGGQDSLSSGKFSNVPVRAGDRIVIRSGGGGGCGSPLERSPELVADDVRSGYVSHMAAKLQYRVVLNADGSVDAVGTESFRSIDR